MTQADRPIPRVPRSRAEWAFEVIAALGVLASVAMLFIYLPDLPDSVPRHFNASGKPDSWTDKGTLYIWPTISVVLYSILTGFSRNLRVFEFPWPITEENASRQYLLARTTFVWIKMVVVVHFAVVEWRMIQVALGKAAGVGVGNMPVLLTIMLAGVLYFYSQAGKAR